ncbi:carbon monoxide dehydrogenase maturation protein [Streptomyces tateyamensis]|uniref:Carbon monoxide dehydrogenase maturation protein n=1 Tax=Streptomyces tateyamensis TaxID=565073 RepID=A0A2V4MWG6_9ACTN|nr:carbon monoxide dehydrogenase maturation protein [Streptomyces tateyamensis]PYC65570.1 carbon monoxide dehydrogenase maturation protein [Streptomyces tateyamensis]
MAVIVVGAAKGSPGASTSALALAAAWPGDVQPLVLEADAGGGDALLRFGLRDSPGLVSLAAASRRAGLTTALLRKHVQRLPGGVEMVVAPAESAQCMAALDALSPAWAEAELDDALLIVDCGGLGVVGPSAEKLLSASDVLVLVTAGSVEALAHTAEAAARLRDRVGTLVVAVVGHCPWPTAEVEAALGADACLMLPHDPPTAALLRGRPAPRNRWPLKPRRPLLDAVRRLALELRRRLPEQQAPADHQPPTGDGAAEQTNLATVLRGELT